MTVRLIGHEESFEVRYSDERPSKYFCFDEHPARRPAQQDHHCRHAARLRISVDGAKGQIIGGQSQEFLVSAC